MIAGKDLLEVTDGNVGALRVLIEAAHEWKDKEIKFLGLLFLCYELDVRGSKVWEYYKDKCGCDIDIFFHRLKSQYKGDGNESVQGTV